MARTTTRKVLFPLVNILVGILILTFPDILAIIVGIYLLLVGIGGLIDMNN